MRNLNKTTESNYVINYDDSFRREMRNIYEYISENLKERKIANKILKIIDNKIKLLEIFPFAFKLYKKEEKVEYRKFIVKNYIIIYKINLEKKEIFISNIYNQKFNYKKKSILL